MSWAGNLTCRTLILSLLCLVGWQSVAFSPALAQGRGRANSPAGAPAEKPSQRWLPLPEGGSADLTQQVQWLQQLQELMVAGLSDRNSSAVPKRPAGMADRTRPQAMDPR